MGRTVAVTWHASFSVAAGVLYFFFVLPRTYELLGDTPHTLGTVLRIVTGALVGLAALPVVFTLLRTRRPEFGTPRLALSLRTASICLHVLAGVLIVGAAISEIWLSVDAAGRWLFGIYGAAAAVALLGMLSFYLAFVAELPPPPPKPVKVKERKSRGRRKRGAETTDEAADAETTDEAEAAEGSDGAEETEAADTDATEGETASAPAPAAESDDTTETADAEDLGSGDAGENTNGKLRNRRPTGKGTLLGRRKRTRGGVALED